MREMLGERLSLWEWLWTCAMTALVGIIIAAIVIGLAT